MRITTIQCDDEFIGQRHMSLTGNFICRVNYSIVNTLNSLSINLLVRNCFTIEAKDTPRKDSLAHNNIVRQC